MARRWGKGFAVGGSVGFRKGGMYTFIIVWTGDFEGVIFRNVGDGESRESVF